MMDKFPGFLMPMWIADAIKLEGGKLDGERER